MKINDQINDIPTIIGNFDVSEFFLLKDIIEKSNFKFENIDKLYFLPSNRWDIETKNGILIKLPKDKLMESFQLLDAFFLKKKNKNFKSIDLRQNKQIIVNE